MIKDLSNGATTVFRGFELAQKPGIRPYMIVPLLVNVILFSIAGFFAIDYINDYLDSWGLGTVDLPSWLNWLESIINMMGSAISWALLSFTILLILFVFGSVFTMVVHLLISPFLGLLAEKVEGKLHTLSYPSHTLMQIAGRSILRELVKLRYWLLRALGMVVLTLILSMIPLVNMITPVLWYLFGSWVLALQYIDLPADNNGVSFDEVLALMRKHRGEIMGFGGVVLLLTSTPIVNLFIIPIAVAGAVIFWVDKMDSLPSTKLSQKDTAQLKG